MSSGSELQKGLEAIGNGGKVAGVYRIMVVIFGIVATTTVSVFGPLAWRTLDRIERTADQMVLAIQENRIKQTINEGNIRSNTQALEDFRRNIEREISDRWTATQDREAMAAQAKRDDAQDRDIVRIEKRVDTEIQRIQSK